MPKGSSNHVRTVSRSWLWIHFVLLSAFFVPPAPAAGQEPPLPSQAKLSAEARSRLTDAAGDPKLQPWQREFMLGVAHGHVDGGATGQPPALPDRALPPAGIASIDGDWTDFHPPSARTGHTAIYDPVRDRMVVFGGYDAGGYRNNVWVLSLAGSPTWSELTPAGAPPPGRRGHTAIYDPVRDRMVVFGGYTPVLRKDVWALSLGASPTWSQLTPAGTLPAARYGHTAIYDPVRDRMVVFGGLAETGGIRNDVWALSLSASPTWSELSPVATLPPELVYHSAIYDPVRDRMVVFGGNTDIPPYLRNGVWALSLAGSPTWGELNPAGVLPSPRGGHTAIYDWVRDRMVVFGGNDNNDYSPNYPNGMWSLSLAGSTTWSELTPAGNLPAGRVYHSGVYDPVRDRMIVFGGSTHYYPDAFFNSVHALSLAGSPAWSVLGQLTPPAATNSYAAIYDPVRDRMVMYGGNNDLPVLNLAGGPSWSAVGLSGTPPAARGGFTSIYDPVRDRMVLFGGAYFTYPTGTLYNDVWALSLAGSPTWSEITPAGSAPSPRWLHTAIYDPVRDRVVVYGGNDAAFTYLNDVWALSLAGTPAWSNLTPAGSSPSPRYGNTTIYDPVRDRMVVFGGWHESVTYNDVWALSLAGSPAWSVLAPAGSPPAARYFHSAVYDPGRDRMMVFGGVSDLGTVQNYNDVWALSLAGGTAWSQLAPGGGPPAGRYYHVAIHDPVRDRMVVFGGTDGNTTTYNDLWMLRNDTVAPTVQVLAPNGGEALDNATPITIAWTASDNVNVAHVNIYLSANGGFTYSLLAAGEPNDGSYDLNGAALTTQGRVRVVAFDPSGNSFADASDANFTISDATPPPMPTPFTGVFTGGPVQLHWGANTAGDFALYHLHRGSTAGFVPGPGNLVASQPDTGFVDAGSSWSYYKLSALDVLGHESGFALLTPAGQVLGVTPPGSPMPVSLGSNVRLNFQNVTSGGLSQLTLQTGGSPPPNGLKLAPSSPPLYYVLSTTATFTGTVTVCVTYDPANVSGPEANLKLMHHDAGSWVQVPTSVDVDSNRICGTVTHFSEFALMEADPTVAVDDAIPSAFLLFCAPNPISGSARVQYDLPVASPVALGLFDLQGRMVRHLERRTSAGPGRYTVQWDGRGVRGNRVPAGIYFLRLDAGSFHQVRRVVVTE